MFLEAAQCIGYIVFPCGLHHGGWLSPTMSFTSRLDRMSGFLRRPAFSLIILSFYVETATEYTPARSHCVCGQPDGWPLLPFPDRSKLITARHFIVRLEKSWFTRICPFLKHVYSLPGRFYVGYEGIRFSLLVEHATWSV